MHPMLDKPSAMLVCQGGPCARMLGMWRMHCEQDHDAAHGEYGNDVKKWHREHHPTCEWTPSDG